MKEDLQALLQKLPHKNGMRFVEEIISADGKEAICRVTVRAATLPHEKDVLPITVAVEYMAQTAAVIGAAAMIGATQVSGETLSGLLVAIRNFSSKVKTVRIGEILYTHASLTAVNDSLSTYECHIRRNDSVIISASLIVQRLPVQNFRMEAE